jgi:uncharacterized membrane protein YbhN (UPF0104 family)
MAFIALGAVLLAAIWLRWDSIAAAISELRGLSVVVVGLLLGLTVYERWSRADIVRGLLGDVSIGRAVTIHDVGTAVSKGVPLGGALGTAVRWSIARDARVTTPRFATMLIAYGIATTFVSWLLPFVALSVDMTQRRIEVIDWVLLAVMGVVLIASIAFWTFVLRSDRLERWGARRTRQMWARLAKRMPATEGVDPADGIAEVRAELLVVGRRPWTLLLRTIGAQVCGALILLVALYGVGVGPELSATEFFRLFFLTHLLGTFAPTPGGVGVVEAGMTGALVAAGVAAAPALAAVLLYRFLTYIAPIVLGASLYVGWRVSRSVSRHIAELPTLDETIEIDPTLGRQFAGETAIQQH